MTFYQPLDLQHIFVNIFSGSTTLFTFVSIIAIAMAAAYFKMSNSTTMLMLALFFFIMMPWVGAWMLLPIIILIGIMTYWILSKQWE